MTDGLRELQVDNLESKEDVNIFEWNISNFKQAFNNTRGGGIWLSPVYAGKCPNQVNSFWKIGVVPRGNGSFGKKHLVVYVVTSEDLNQNKRVVKAKYRMWLLKGNQQKLIGKPSYDDTTETVVGGKYYSLGYAIATHSELFDGNIGFLDGDVLRIQIKLQILNDEIKIKDAPPEKQNKGQLHKNLSELLESSFSDVTIEVEDSTFKVYKGILSCRSPVFAAMFKNDMTESLTDTVKIEDFSSKTVKGMLEFIYFENVESVDEDFMELLKIADKYELTELKMICIKAAILKISTENVVELLIIGDMYNVPELKYRAMVFITSNKANPMFSHGNQNEALEKLAKQHPMLLLEMFQNVRNNDVRVHRSEESKETLEEVTRFTTKQM